MPIVRSKPSKNFTVLDNRAIEIPNVSFEAEGLLHILLSKPPKWSVSVTHLASIKSRQTDSGKKGRGTGSNAVYRMLSELIDAGFIARSKLSSGETEYVVYDVPNQDKPNQDKPNQDKPNQDKPNQDMGTLVSTEEQVSIKKREVSTDLMSGKPDATVVIEHLNAVCGSKFQTSSKSNIDNINGRLNDGHTVDDLKAVINYKCKEWATDPSMAQYLRPKTLFQPGKFDGYLIAAKAKPKPPENRPRSKLLTQGW